MKYGLLHIEDPRDLLLGSESNEGFFDINCDNWEDYLPTKEKQHSAYFDSMGCTTFAMLNQAETYFNYLIENELMSIDNANWLNNNGYIDENGKVNFSERFCLIQNGTTNRGNYFTKVYQSAYDETGTGLIPESMLPYPREQRTPVFDWDDFYDESVITKEMRELGKEFLRRFTIRYYRVNQSKESRDIALKSSPLLCGVKTSCTEKPDCGGTSNHAVLYYTDKLKDGWLPVFDSYESQDKDFIRLMDKDYQFAENMRAIKIKENTMTNTKLFKDKNSKTVYFALPILNEEAFKSMAGNFGISVPMKEVEGIEKIDWEKVNIEGQVELKS